MENDVNQLQTKSFMYIHIFFRRALMCIYVASVKVVTKYTFLYILRLYFVGNVKLTVNYFAFRMDTNLIM